MGQKTGIAWTDATWNPVRGCSRVSEGCRNCYAERIAMRFSVAGTRAKPKFLGFASPGRGWTGRVELIPEKLDEPLHWKKPRRVFVNSMSDLFHENLSNEDIAAVFSRMVLASQHTFQVLTKRPRSMLGFMKWCESENEAVGGNLRDESPWPAPNVWLGVSVEDQETADERIPILCATPAALRFVSYEPALGPVNFGPYLSRTKLFSAMPGFRDPMGGIDWLIVGGESGPGARPFDLAWARAAVAQCKAIGVPVFVKQLGRRVLGRVDDDGGVDRWILPDLSEWAPPIIRSEFSSCDGKMPKDAIGFKLFDNKGANPSEWPGDLRVQEFPA